MMSLNKQFSLPGRKDNEHLKIIEILPYPAISNVPDSFTIYNAAGGTAGGFLLLVVISRGMLSSALPSNRARRA